MFCPPPARHSRQARGAAVRGGELGRTYLADAAAEESKRVGEPLAARVPRVGVKTRDARGGAGAGGACRRPGEVVRLEVGRGDGEGLAQHRVRHAAPRGETQEHLVPRLLVAHLPRAPPHPRQRPPRQRQSTPPATAVPSYPPPLPHTHHMSLQSPPPRGLLAERTGSVGPSSPPKPMKRASCASSPSPAPPSSSSSSSPAGRAGAARPRAPLVLVAVVAGRPLALRLRALRPP